MDDKNWVPLREALEILDMTPGAFTYHVRSGRVRTQEGRGPRDNRYSLQDVFRLKDERKPRTYKPSRRQGKAERPPVIYDWIAPRDIPVVLKLDQERYGEVETEFEINYQEVAAYQEQYKKNPYISMAVWSPDRSECLGYIASPPIPEQVALDIMAGRRDESSLELDEIETYERPGGFILLCRSVVAKRDHGYLLTGILKRIMDFWIARYPEQYVSRIYAQTASPEGLRLLRHLYLMPMAGYPDNAYYLDLARFNPSRVIQEFLATLQKKAPLPNALRVRYTPPLPQAEK